MGIHVLGVSGSPRHGATDVLVQAALMGAAVVEGTSTEFITLAGKVISPCDGCAPCLEQGRCRIQDDMQPLYESLWAADAIVLGSPVYFGSPSALCKAFMERVQGFGSTEKVLRLKVGGAIATGQGRNGGQEATLLAIHYWFHINDMLPVGITTPSGQLGVTAQSGANATDVLDDVVELKKMGKQMKSVEAAWLYGRKIATVATIVRQGIATSGLDLPDQPYGQNLPAAFPDQLYELR